MQDIEIIELSLQDLKLLDTLFLSDEQCSQCYCMNHRLKDSFEVEGEVARQEFQRYLKQEKVFGVLAKNADMAVGWLGLDPINNLPGHDCYQKSDDLVWAIHCLFIHPHFRSKGLSKKMIEKSLYVAQSHGASSVKAFPIPPDFIEHNGFIPEDGFSGAWKIYKELGFQPKNRIDDFYYEVELSLLKN